MNQVPVHGMRQCLNGVRTITCIPSLLPDSNECGMYLKEGLRLHNGLHNTDSGSGDLVSMLQLLDAIKGLVHNTTIANDRIQPSIDTVSYTHLRAHETVLDLVCRLLLEKKKNKQL
eukprot:TRINITY_DN41261_c0_g1_i1.p1 TRINITY_DN41261_c0_g1~~TRINITY_DN41261_c0_g1_i1.p1  ORF type:complete len:116 (+),score=0.87 TRINITY_DN41261_c0_g1_i1:113-460(+)